MSVPVDERTQRNISGHLAGTLRLVGIGKLILAVETLILAFTGYETPRSVNGSLLLIGINLLVLGGACLAAGRQFDRASRVESIPFELATALEKTNKIFGYYLILIGLAVLGVGIDLAMFLGKVLGR